MTTEQIARAYDRAAAGWHAGPEPVYARLAEALVATSPVPVPGASVLDVGAGTAVAADAALARGARSVVAADVSLGMLGHRRHRVLPAVCADLARLPFRDEAFDLVIAAFCLGHLAEPGPAMQQIRRVGRALIASAFAPGWTHPAKATVDQVAAGFGYRQPAWYARVKAVSEPAVDDAGALAQLARAAGFATVGVTRVEVASGLSSAAEIVGWRLGMAHLAPFVSGLPADRRVRLRARAEAAVAGSGPVTISMLALSAS